MSEIKDTNIHNTALFISNLNFSVILTHYSFVVIFNLKLETGGGRPWHQVHSSHLGLYDLWGSLRGGGGGGDECNRNWVLASPFSWVEVWACARPGLPCSEAPGFQAAVEIPSSGTLSQVWAEWRFSHQWCNPTTALLKPTTATRHHGQPRYLWASESPLLG